MDPEAIVLLLLMLMNVALAVQAKRLQLRAERENASSLVHLTTRNDCYKLLTAIANMEAWRAGYCVPTSPGSPWSKVLFASEGLKKSVRSLEESPDA